MLHAYKSYILYNSFCYKHIQSCYITKVLTIPTYLLPCVILPDLCNCYIHNNVMNENCYMLMHVMNEIAQVLWCYIHSILLTYLFDIIIYHGNKAVYNSWIDAKELAHNSCKPVQDCWVKNNINLPKNRLTIHFVTYISRVLISHKYSPFIHIYCLVSCCLTSATVIYITML